VILLVDIGNSRLKYASLEDGSPKFIGSHDYYASPIDADSIQIADRVPDAIYQISVADESIEHELDLMCQQRWGLQPYKLTAEGDCSGVTNGYIPPESLGVDRWAAMIGAYHLINDAVVVVDCGTACTIDIINSSGLHSGGAIIPGYQMMQQALKRGTARIKPAAASGVSHVPGVTTADCLHYGAIEASCGLVERVTQWAENESGKAVTVVVTGGDALQLLPHLHRPVHYERNLVFLGMKAMVAEKLKGVSR